MRVVMVMLVFIVYWDVCDTTCCCLLFKWYLFTYAHCLCSLCVGPTFSFEGIKNFLTWLNVDNDSEKWMKINCPTFQKRRLAIFQRFAMALTYWENEKLGSFSSWQLNQTQLRNLFYFPPWKINPTVMTLSLTRRRWGRTKPESRRRQRGVLCPEWQEKKT